MLGIMICMCCICIYAIIAFAIRILNCVDKIEQEKKEGGDER